jgi:hypothetical protein
MATARMKFLCFLLAAIAIMPALSSAQGPAVTSFRFSDLPKDFMVCNKSVYLHNDTTRAPVIAGRFAKKGQSVMININGKLETLRCEKPLKDGQPGDAVFFNKKYKATLAIKNVRRAEDGAPNARLTVVSKTNGTQSAIQISDNVWTMLCGEK